MVNKPFAEYEAATCFVGAHFSEFECLPDTAKYPIFILVYSCMLRGINDPKHLKLLSRDPLPTIKSMCEHPANQEM